MSALRQVTVMAAEVTAFVLLIPLLIWSRLPIPEYSAFTAPSQWLSYLPGYSGVLLRRVWYRHTLRRCGSNLTVDWLAAIRTRESEIGERCTLGVGTWVGWVQLGDDVMTGSHVALLSGARQHDFSDLSRPMRDQPGMKKKLIIGSDVWIGTQVVIMANVSQGTVVGAGCIVTKTYPPFAILAGNPARALRYRNQPRSSDDAD
jgi:hypothetical protein